MPRTSGLHAALRLGARTLAKILRKIGSVGSGLYKFLNTNLGTWCLTSIVLGSAVFVYSERNQCIQIRDSDVYTDEKNQFELLSMYAEFTKRTAIATTRDDLEQAIKQLGPGRNSYKFSDNKEKTDAQIIWEHILIANRWGGKSPTYWSGKTESDMQILTLQVDDFVRSKSDDQNRIKEFAHKADEMIKRPAGPQDLADPGFLFIQSHILWENTQKGNCGFFTILNETFRKIDSAERS